MTNAPENLPALRARPDADQIDVFIGGSWASLDALPHVSLTERFEWRMRHGGRPMAVARPITSEIGPHKAAAEALRAAADVLERQAAGLRLAASTIERL